MRPRERIDRPDLTSDTLPTSDPEGAIKLFPRNVRDTHSPIGTGCGRLFKNIRPEVQAPQKDRMSEPVTKARVSKPPILHNPIPSKTRVMPGFAAIVKSGIRQ